VKRRRFPLSFLSGWRPGASEGQPVCYLHFAGPRPGRPGLDVTGGRHADGILDFKNAGAAFNCAYAEVTQVALFARGQICSQATSTTTLVALFRQLDRPGGLAQAKSLAMPMTVPVVRRALVLWEWSMRDRPQAGICRFPCWKGRPGVQQLKPVFAVSLSVAQFLKPGHQFDLLWMPWAQSRVDESSSGRAPTPAYSLSRS
jgi:hypothetical protein